jgi:DNA polymerase II large subunit
MSKEHHQYISVLESQLERVYWVAKKAREKNLDPTSTPEPKIAEDMAGLVEGLVGPSGVGESIRELSKKLPREELAFKIAEETIYGKFGHMGAREAAEQAIRTALAIFTEGITAAPLQGVARVTIKSNLDRTKYLAIYFSQPIRSAGGTDQALTLVVGDFVRRLLGLDRYKPTPEEIGRFIEEIRLYERSVSRFQYRVSDEELETALQSLPVEVNGTESDPVEVSSFRSLPRVETNRVRGGALRVVNDGVVGRSLKVWAIVKKIGVEGWDWLKRMPEIEEKKTAGFMEEIIAGRPVFSFPSRQGGFRLRYGRARNTGLAAVGVHPATMMVLQNFLAAGTQLRVERPGKAGTVLPVDFIESPIVRLKDGSVTRVTTQNFESVRNTIDKILFLGDILIGFGDFLYNNKPLPPSGYTEEWWSQELQAVIEIAFDGDLDAAAQKAGTTVNRLEMFLKNPFENKPTAEEALRLASALHVPLHPTFTYFWHNISTDDFSKLKRWLMSCEVGKENEANLCIAGTSNASVKVLLEKLCVPHRVINKRIKIEREDASIFAFCLGLQVPRKRTSQAQPVLKVIENLTGIVVREKAPTVVGARMGRPEKAKRREMRPLVHVLFPTGLAGGSRRNLAKASSKRVVEVELVKRRCPTCRKITFKVKCSRCDTETIIEQMCPQCKRVVEERLCPICGGRTKGFERQAVNFKELIDEACERLDLAFPPIVKGVKGLINESKIPETVEKGILRAKYDLSVFKDGTTRFDATNAPLTHFKAEEIGVSVDRLKQLGYRCDANGNPLIHLGQVCELKTQDVVIPAECAEYFVRVAGFLDELLEKVYGLPAYYNVKRTGDLVGHLIIGLAPHTSVGILGRIIGFTRLQICYAHPLWHSAKRRDCDGDEDALMLGLDTVLNFSETYLPVQIGGIMDAPLFILPVVSPIEVQRQAHEVDVAGVYPLAFYERTLRNVSPHDVSPLIDIVEHRLGREEQVQGFNYTVPVSNVDSGNRESTYKKLGRMVDKLKNQLQLAEKIEAVDAKEVAETVLTTHFMRDISGNLRAFSTQSFRCKICNKKFRRLPLGGVCLECGGPLTLTVYRGGIQKYLEAANQLIHRYELGDYYAQRLILVQEEITSLFEGKKPKQVSLKDFIA